MKLETHNLRSATIGKRMTTKDKNLPTSPCLMSHIPCRSNPAFTLIELVIYVSIFVVVSGLLTTILITTTRVENSEIVSTQVGQELNLVLTTVQRLVRDASLIECVNQSDCSLSQGSFLKLRFKDQTKDPTCVYLDNDIIKIAQGPDLSNKENCDLTTATNLTTGKVNGNLANSLNFTKFDIPGGHATVQIDAQLSYNSTNPQLQITKTLRSAVGRVSAATFDSDLLPDANNLRSIGQVTGSPLKWKDIFVSNLLGLGNSPDDPISTTAGTLYYNTTGNNVKVYNGASWQNVGSQTPWTQNIDAAGFTLFGNSTASGNLTLDSTSNAAKGFVILNPTGGNVGIGTASPITQLHIPGRVPSSAIGSVATESGPVSVYVQGRYAYVVNNVTGTLQIFDISNPSSPALVGSRALGTNPSSIYVQGRYAYVANSGSSNLQIIDVSNPAFPGSMPLFALAGQPQSVYVQGRYAYMLVNSTLQIIDVSNPASPAFVESIATGQNPLSVYVQGRYVYVVNQVVNTLQIFDVSDPVSISLVGSIATDTGPFSVYIQGRYAYVVNQGGNTLQIFDVSNTSSISLTGSIATGTFPSSIYVQGRYAYVTNFNSNTFQIFDISNPASPASVGSTATGVNPRSIYVQGRYAYVTNNLLGALQIFDVGGSYIQQLEAGGIETGTFTTRNNLHVGNDLDVRGGAQIARGLGVTGPLSVYGGGTGSVFVVNRDGNVGIGMTNPSAKLHIGGVSGTDGIKFPDGTLQTTAAGSPLLVADGVTQIGAQADTDRSANSTSFIKVKEFEINTSGTYTTSTDYGMGFNPAGGEATVQFRKNEATFYTSPPFSGIWTNTSASAAVIKGDKIQIYCMKSLVAGDPCRVRNSRLLYGSFLLNTVLLD